MNSAPSPGAGRSRVFETLTCCDQYAPGHTPSEIERLIEQGRWFGDLTERLFRDAGMVPGMSVLDVGCGAGDVSLAGITRAMLPMITRTEVATAESVDVDTLETGLREEAVELDATTVAPPLIGAWARN